MTNWDISYYFVPFPGYWMAEVTWSQYGTGPDTFTGRTREEVEAKVKLTAEVTDYAYANYNGSAIWSALVETTTPAELYAELAEAGVTTVEEAIKFYAPVGAVLDDRWADAQNSKF